ncbi:probable rRNA-processing protein EBP2 homolog isoform X1 [Nilaparvata lugens]|uniref:probable rRNA-processing protein EBP2 homolog isoform X1 n=1 Tax=Nilaparvata lugens TaxID=108931 RepID=UPI00193CBC7D|nr:probable rRNA-processing protein EBP2 homolog isoform X1 [Nilaparvata lugens]
MVKIKKLKIAHSPVQEDEEFDSGDSDAELQDLFSKGLLKPGLNVPADALPQKKQYANNIPALELKLQEIQKNNYPWIERLDLVTGYAPLAPEMALQIEEETGKNELNSDGSSQLDEFKRESLFHRQAQAAVIEGIGRLKSLGVPTRRPDDFFAEMAKTDEHMQKIRSMLVKTQAAKERIEKVRKIREQRKMSKKIQAENRLKKQNEKKSMLDEVKKFRKGIRKDLDFLDNKNKPSNRSQLKRKHKDSKFGFGGKKRGLKRNTRESAAGDFDGGNAKGKGSHRGPPNKGKVQNKRPGKQRRQQIKSKRKH